MSEIKFTPQQIANFKAYREVQMGGAYNMFDPRAQQSTGLSKEDYIFVMKNYRELANLAGVDSE